MSLPINVVIFCQYRNFGGLKALIWKAACDANQSFQGSLSPESSGWWSDPQYFKDPANCMPQPGNINLSPAWFQQAKDVRLTLVSDLLYLQLDSFIRQGTTHWKFQQL